LKTVERNRKTAVFVVLLILLGVLLIGALPNWPYSRYWGYAPSGNVTLAAVAVALVALTGPL
jgi:hypothetical protein